MSTLKTHQFQTVVTLPTLGTPPGIIRFIPHRHCNHCGQRQHTAHQRNPRHQHVEPQPQLPTAWNPIHPSSRGEGWMPWVLCLPCLLSLLPCPCWLCWPRTPPLPRLDATARHPTLQHDTNTPHPPHGRSGQDITGVAVEEEGGGFPVCVSTQAKSIPL